jgi:NAD(P)-dependent dehydrogenase (short-subunit alcohol dehydrogenase family)
MTNNALRTSLDGSVAIVTGARGGIGRAICDSLAASGARVVATGRGSESGSVECAAAWMQHDVTSEGDWVRVVRECVDRFGKLDCVINNAGTYLVERIESTTVEEWRRVMQVNVESVLIGLRTCLQPLRESGRNRPGGAAVVNIASVASTRGVPLNAAYCASKGALTLLTKAAAREFAELRYPIRVNSVHPAGVDTPMMDSILQRYVELGAASSLDEQRILFNSKVALRRVAQPHEIAGVVAFLCSDAASFTTGSQFFIDGGVTA